MVPADASFVQYQHYPNGDCIAPDDPLVNDWLTATVLQCHDPIIKMLRKRDILLMEKKQELGSTVFENKKVEILSRQPLDL